MTFKANTQEDIVVICVGCTGSGRTTFIELLSGKAIRSKISKWFLGSKTKSIRAVRVHKGNLVLVDTPGYNLEGIDAKGQLDAWLQKNYQRSLRNTDTSCKVCILFFRDITKNRETDKPDNLLGTAIKKNRIVFVTTMWNNPGKEGINDIRLAREASLLKGWKTEYLGESAQRDDVLAQFNGTEESAKNVARRFGWV